MSSVRPLVEQRVPNEGATCVQHQKSQDTAQGAPNSPSRSKTRDLPENSCSGQGEARPGSRAQAWERRAHQRECQKREGGEKAQKETAPLSPHTPSLMEGETRCWFWLPSPPTTLLDDWKQEGWTRRGACSQHGPLWLVRTPAWELGVQRALPASHKWASMSPATSKQFHGA